MERIKNFFLKNITTRQTIAKNTFWLFVSEGVSRLLKMALVIYAARVLGTEGWGTFSYALSLGSLLMIFADIGLSGLITREIVQQKESYRSFISTALFFKTILLLISTAAVLCIGPLITHVPAAKTLLPLIAVTLFFDAIRDLILIINTAFEKMERDMVAKTVMGIVTIGLGVVLLILQPLPRSIAIAYTGGSIVGAVIALWSVRHDLRGLFGRADRTLWYSVLHTTLPFAAISLVSNVMANTDIYLLGIWRNATEIGLYTSVQRIYQFILVIPVIVATAIFPLLSRLAVQDSTRFADILGKVSAYIFMIGLPISVGGIVLSKDIVLLLFGTAYQQAAPILSILLCMLLAAFPLVLFSNSVVAYNGQRALAVIYACGMIGNAILNIILIPHFGAIGSAVATLVSTSCITFLTWLRLYRLSHMHILSRLGRSLLGTAVMAGVVFLLRDTPLYISIPTGIIMYITVLLITKEPLLREIRTIRAGVQS